jgi:hypothetical protein
MSITRDGDILVGFYLDSTNSTPISYHITIGGCQVCDEMIIHPGEFQYCLENTHVFPMIALQYSELKIHTTDDCLNMKPVFAFLNTEPRRHLARCTNVFHLNSRDAILRSQFGHFRKDGELESYLEKYPDDNGVYTVVPNMNDVPLILPLVCVPAVSVKKPVSIK